MLEMKCQTAFPRLVEKSFLGHLCLKHTDVSALNVSHICGRAWKFQQAQRSSAALGRRVQVFPPKNISSWQVFKQIWTPYKAKPVCGTKILGTRLFRTTQMCQGSTCHVVAQHGDALLLTWEVCATIAIKTSKEISQCHVPKKTRQTKATFVAQRFLGHNCWGLHRCVRGQRVMLLHSMEISASLTKLLCWLGKSAQPLPSRLPKILRNAMFQKKQGKRRQTDKGNIWHKDSWDTTV